METQLTQVLLNCTNEDFNVRSLAEKWLQEAEKQNPALFYQMLSAELASADKPEKARNLAGLIIKNALTAKDESKRLQLFQRWIALDANAKLQIKGAALATLAAPVRDARLPAAQVVAKIAEVELPQNLWPDLMTTLFNNMQQENDYLKQSTLEVLGFICEAIDPNVLTNQSNQILTVVCKGMKEANSDIKVAACKALYAALEFVKSNFERENERNYIMQVLTEGCVSTDSKVRVASLECVVQIASLYYDKLGQYMQRLFNITLEAIKKDEEPVALQAVEFWSTISDEEIFLMEEAEDAAEMNQQPQRLSQNFIRGALKYLIPLLTEALTKQQEDADEDEWNIAMAAGTCMALVAQSVGDEIIQHVMPFVTQNINNENWKFREAATLAFGAVLEGPKNYLQNLIGQAMPVLLSHMKDPNVCVKDTTAWTIGRICQLHTDTVTPALPQVISVLVESLSDNPRVAANVCWAIHNLAQAFEDDQNKQTSPLSSFFAGVMGKLSQTTEREDSEENNLLSSAYEAINVMIQCGAKDTHSIISQLAPLFADRLAKTFMMTIINQDDKEKQTELQALLCGVLQVIIQKLGESIKPIADKLMGLFLQVFNASSKSVSVHEEALMAVGALANAVEGDFEKYMTHFRPFLTMGLRSQEEYQVCAVAVGVVGDLSRALGPKITPYCDEIVSLLLQDLQSPMLNRNVKPPILSCFGDVALAIGGEFVKYLGVVMNMLQQASSTSVDINDPDLLDYFNSLRESIFEAYTGIIQGLRSDSLTDPHFLPYVNHVVNFVGFVYADKARTDSVTRAALGVIGDLGHALGSRVKQPLSQPFVKSLIQECANSSNVQTRDVGIWVKEVIQKM